MTSRVTFTFLFSASHWLRSIFFLLGCRAAGDPGIEDVLATWLLSGFSVQWSLPSQCFFLWVRMAACGCSGVTPNYLLHFAL
jgi:hypothetical protein